LERRVKTPNVDIESRAYEMAATVLESAAENWIRERWNTFPKGKVLFRLAQASASCLPPEEGFGRVVDALHTIPQKELAHMCIILSWFRSVEI
jgi:hypothetical protein